MINQRIAEALGICLHDTTWDSPGMKCSKCGYEGIDLTGLTICGFESWDGFGVIMDKGPKQEWWGKFIGYLNTNDFNFADISGHGYECIPIYYINPSHLAEALEEFLKERSNE